jgi:hypothetical protein
MEKGTTRSQLWISDNYKVAEQLKDVQANMRLYVIKALQVNHGSNKHAWRILILSIKGFAFRLLK